jgi:hypothetical protein
LCDLMAMRAEILFDADRCNTPFDWRHGQGKCDKVWSESYLRPI